jgi:shikimate dehydrogenase
MSTHAFATLGIDAAYVACDVEPASVADAIRGLAALGATGANVTVPHKMAAVSSCDSLDAGARAIGAVNTLRFDRGRVHGHNTDARGAVDALLARGFDPRGARAVVLGAGGAARAIAVGLVTAGAARVTVRARDPERAAEVAEIVRRAGGETESGALTSIDDAIASAQLIVQATSAGLDGREDDLAVIRSLETARTGTVAMDAVYSPRETRWLEAARAQGLVTVDGLGMLAAQAARALEIWFGSPVNVEILRQFLDAPERRG